MTDTNNIKQDKDKQIEKLPEMQEYLSNFLENHKQILEDNNKYQLKNIEECNNTLIKNNDNIKLINELI